MLEPSLLTQLKGHFSGLTEDVELLLAIDDSDTSLQLRSLAEDLASCSDRLTTGSLPDAARTPTLVVRRAGTVGTVSFCGLPMGHEFTSLVLAVLQAGGVAPKITDAQLKRIKSLPAALSIETYFSQACLNCPDVVQALNTIAVLNPTVSHAAIDGASFAAEVEERAVKAVPAVFLNGELFHSGRATLDELLDKLGAAHEPDAAPSADPYDVIIVGGGPAGVAAGIYTARKGMRTALVAERLGGQVLDTMSIENLVGTPHTEGPVLGRELEAHVRSYPVDVIANRRVAQLHPASAEGGLHRAQLADGAVLSARAIILTPGAAWRTMGVPGETEYRNRGVTFCPHCDGPLFTGKDIAVIGGGNSGVEAAIDLAGIAAHVTLVEFMPELRADAVLQRTLAKLPNVDVLTNAAVTAVIGDGREVTAIEYTDRSDGKPNRLPVSGVFVQIGLSPGTQWLNGTVDLNGRGEIVVDERGATSLPGVYAAGDATTVPFKQIVTAMGSGAAAALGAFEYLVLSGER